MKRRLEGRRKSTASKTTMPSGSYGRGRGGSRERASWEGPDAKNRYGATVNVAEGKSVVKFGTVEEA